MSIRAIKTFVLFLFFIMVISCENTIQTFQVCDKYYDIVLNDSLLWNTKYEYFRFESKYYNPLISFTSNSNFFFCNSSNKEILFTKNESYYRITSENENNPQPLPKHCFISIKKFGNVNKAFFIIWDKKRIDKRVLSSRHLESYYYLNTKKISAFKLDIDQSTDTLYTNLPFYIIKEQFPTFNGQYIYNKLDSIGFKHDLPFSHEFYIDFSIDFYGAKSFLFNQTADSLFISRFCARWKKFDVNYEDYIRWVNEHY